jgi:hypothetical protein
MSTDAKRQQLIELEALDFTNKGEAFVECRFLTPLLEALGYETHKDYEVLRHGDDGAAFKLQYPPVKVGAVRVKHYNPDYIPTIRKKMFWIIEAKSPKSVTYPFAVKYLVQDDLDQTACSPRSLRTSLRTSSQERNFLLQRRERKLRRSAS